MNFVHSLYGSISINILFSESVTGNKLAYVIQVYGIVKYEIHREQKSFHQNFMIITDEDNKWKIASDCFRLQDAIQKS